MPKVTSRGLCQSHAHRIVAILILTYFCLLGSASAEVSRDSLKLLTKRTVTEQKTPGPWIALGDALLENEQFSKAEDAFIKASRYTKDALPHLRLGDTYLLMHGRTRKALTKYRKARRLDPTSMDAQMGVARSLIQLGNTEAEDEIYRTIALDSTYAPAHLMLAEFYRDTEEPVAMLLAYEDYLKLRPNDVEGHLGLALAYTEQGRYDLVMAITTQMYKIHHDTRYLAYLGQAMAARGDAEEAVRNFKIYILNLPPDIRAHYEDLSLIATKDELRRYEEIPESKHLEFLQEFWRKRDLSITTGGRAREAEHYRRVWYALTHFAKVIQPWDKRGEVYIRYGEPDYRSRSGHENPLPPPAVMAVKQRNSDALYRRGANLDESLRNVVQLPRKDSVDDAMGMTQGAVSERVDRIRSDGEALSRNRGSGISVGWPLEVQVGNDQVYLNIPPGLESGGWIEPVFPVPRSGNGSTNAPWESWVYAGLGGGIEVVFIDQFFNGQWDYAPLPAIHHAGLVATAMEYTPAPVIQNVAAEVPEYFDTPPGVDPLEFYYDLATYRADSNRSEVEVYLGIPPSQIGYKRTFGDNVAQLSRTIVVADWELNEVARQSADLSFSVGASPETLVARASFIPDAMKLDVAPGSYRLAVQVTDKVTGKWGVYHQKLEVPGYTDSLSISDVHVAWEFAYESSGNDRFKRVDPAFPEEAVWVTPMPTRNFLKKQKVRLYYEIYNLEKDSFGQTKYEVAYRVRQQTHRSAGLFGAVASGFGKLFSNREPDVVVSYESTSSSTSEPVYFELEGGKLEEGLNEISVTITDLIADTSVTKKAVFKVSNRQQKKNQFTQGADQEFDDIMQR